MWYISQNIRVKSFRWAWKLNFPGVLLFFREISKNCFFRSVDRVLSPRDSTAMQNSVLELNFLATKSGFDDSIIIGYSLGILAFN